MSAVGRSTRSKERMPPEPVTALPGTGSRAPKRAPRTPQAADGAAVATPERRILAPAFVIEQAFVSRAAGRLSGQDIKDAVQGLIQVHKSADEAGVTGLPQPEGSFAGLKMNELPDSFNRSAPPNSPPLAPASQEPALVARIRPRKKVAWEPWWWAKLHCCAHRDRGASSPPSSAAGPGPGPGPGPGAARSTGAVCTARAGVIDCFNRLPNRLHPKLDFKKR
jgi:hypothetical protein